MASEVKCDHYAFRVGPERRGYKYQRLDGVFLGGYPVYRCAHGRDREAWPLYLYFDVESSTWHAMRMGDAVTSGQDILDSGTFAFRAVDQDDDVRQSGSHRWQCRHQTRRWRPMR